MRRLIRSMITLVFFSVLCASVQAADKPPFTLTISGSERVILGDEIRVAAVLKNESASTVKIEWGIRHIVLVHADSGEQPRRNTGLYAGSSGFLSLDPGQTSTQNVVISGNGKYGKYGEYDLNRPGKYVVQVQRPMDDAGYPKGSIVESNKITITILPKEPGGSK